MRGSLVVSILAGVIALAGAVEAADCPRFRGPDGDGVFRETGLMKKWPQGGPKLAWTVKGLGQGYSSAVVANGDVYVTGMDEKNQGSLFAFALDGSAEWKVAYGQEPGKSGPMESGTRATPTIDGERAYLVTGPGKFIAFDAAKGQVLKTVDLLEQFKVKQAQFGFAEAVLVDGNKLIVTVGAPDASLVAFDKNTGKVLWQSKGLSQAPGCCSPRFINHNGRKLILTMLAQAVAAVDPATGEVVWQHEFPQRAGVQPNPPLYQDGMIYVSSGMGTGGAMLSLAETNPNTAAKWTDKTLDCQMQGTLLIVGYIYGTAQSGNKG